MQSFELRCLVLSLVEIGTIVLEKIIYKKSTNFHHFATTQVRASDPTCIFFIKEGKFDWKVTSGSGKEDFQLLLHV